MLFLFQQLIANLTSNEYADAIRQLITDNTTHNISYYGPTFYDRLTTGTAHLSVVDAEGNAVAVTSTVNARQDFQSFCQLFCMYCGG